MICAMMFVAPSGATHCRERTSLFMSPSFKRFRSFASFSLLLLALPALAESAPVSLRGSIEAAVAGVKPGLVRIDVVETYYREGRELKAGSSGSGVVITPEGHIVTNHHVAGHAKQLKCTFENKEEIEAELVGTDPLTDIAVIKLKAPGRTFPVAAFGDSTQAQVGDQVLAMGSPLALSQSVTLGIISNNQMTLPEWAIRGGGLEQDGEDVGSLVRWIGHDAEIHPGNSGGPLVNLQGEIIGINEIKLGLSGAIPGNLAREVAEAIIAEGSVKRAWLGVQVQPRLKHDGTERGVLVGGVFKGGPADQAGLQSGDLITAINGAEIDVQFSVQLPDFNRTIAALPIGETATLSVTRAGANHELKATPELREATLPRETELKQWGLTVRNLSRALARELKRSSTDGVLITSVRPGGPSGDAKPAMTVRDVIVAVDGKPIKNVEALREITAELTKDTKTPIPVLTNFERKTGELLTVVKVGIKELEDPGLEVKKAWLPVETQVITRDIATGLGMPDLTGFRVTNVYRGSTAEAAGLKTGDMILSVDGEKMTASQPEHYEELNAFVRQLAVGSKSELGLRRGNEELKLSVELVRAPKLAREMKKYENEAFEFTVRDITFFDKAKESWQEQQQGVLVESVRPGGWADLGHMQVDDLLLEVDGKAMHSVDSLEAAMTSIAEAKPKSVVYKVLRGIQTLYIELEPRWDSK